VFHMVIAVLCASNDYPGELGGDYPSACATLGLEPTPGGYGLVLGQDDDGARWTQVTAGVGVDLVRSVVTVWASGLEAGLELPRARSWRSGRAGRSPAGSGSLASQSPHDSPDPPLGKVGQ